MLRLPVTSQIAELPVEKFAAVLAFIADDVVSIRVKLRSEQQFNEIFAYSHNSLRARSTWDRERVKLPVPYPNFVVLAVCGCITI
jgi:hypothetical protein